MPDLWMDVDTALSEVPVNILPLIDDTDFKSREESVAYNATGLELIWHFTTPGGATTATVVTPTTGGDYDWAHQDGGVYTIEIPASGGASINNDTEGFGWFTGVATGILPWRGPVIGLRAAPLNDLLIENAFSATRGLAGTALPAAAADAAGGLPVSDAGALDVDTLLGRITGNVALASVCTDARLGELDGANLPADVAAVKSDTAAILVDTGTDGVVVAAASKTGYVLSAAGVQAIWDALSSALTTAGSIGKRIVDYLTGDVFGRLGAPAGASTAADIAAVKAQTAAIETDTQDLQTQIGVDGAGLTAIGDARLGNLDAAVSSRSSHSAADVKTAVEAAGSHLTLILEDTGTTIPGAISGLNNLSAAQVNAECDTAISDAALATAANLATVDTVVDAIKAKTDNLPADPAGVSNIPTAAAVSDQVWEEAIADHSGTVGSTAEALNAAGAAGDPWTTNLPGAYGAGSAGYIMGNNLNAPVGTVDTVVDAIKAKTDLIPASPAAVGSEMALADDAITAAKFDETTAFPVKSADAGLTALARTGADGDTLETLSDQIDGVGGGGGGDATAANQVLILEDLEDIKGTGFVKDVNSLVNVTGAAAVNLTIEATVET